MDTNAFLQSIQRKNIATAQMIIEHLQIIVQKVLECKDYRVSTISFFERLLLDGCQYEYLRTGPMMRRLSEERSPQETVCWKLYSLVQLIFI